MQVGPLTFAVSILDAAPPADKPAAPAASAAKASLDDVSTDDIDSWLVGPNTPSAAEMPTTVYGGDTLTISAFKGTGATPAKPPTPPSASDDEYERQPEDLEEGPGDEPFEDEEDDGEETIEEGVVTVGDVPEEFMDESNPFYAAKKAQQLQAKGGGTGSAAKQPSFKDTSDAAGDILRRLMERRRAEKS